MAIRISCPACKAVNTAADDKRGRTIRCSKCDEPIAIAAAKNKPAEEQAIQSTPKLKVKPAPSRDEDDDDYDRPAKKKKKSQPAKSGSGVLLAVLGGGAALLLLVLCGGGFSAFYFLRTKPIDPAPLPIVNLDPKKKDIDPGPNLKPPEPPELPKKVEPLPAAMAADTVKRVKQATVYLHVTMPGGQAAEGSGFFAFEPGIIITNAHVLGMLQSTSQPPKQVDVVLDSGLPTETKMIGAVLGVDRDSDLAVVRVPNNAKLPTPLALNDQPLVETQPVFIFGFPFGAKLGKNITVAPSAISSFRTDQKTGILEKIQVNGGMHPGNSGGPVVNTLGNLVGVSVSGMPGTQINNAVPHDNVRMIMEGRFAQTKLGEGYASAGQPKLPVEYKCLDPLGRIRDMRVEIWTGQPGPGRPHSFAKPAQQPGDSARQTHAITYRDGTGSLDVPLPTLKAGEVYWLQPVITTAKGPQWGPAQATPVNFVLLERVPANLTVSFTAQKERTSKMSSVFTITETFGKKKNVDVDRTSAELLEVVTPEVSNGKNIAKIHTAFNHAVITLLENGRPLVLPSHAQALGVIRTMPPTFVIDDTNHTHSYIKVGLNPNNPQQLRERVDEFNSMVHNPYEAATIQMPNRVVQPMETFPSKSTMMFRRNAKVAIVDLVLNCTYEGKRVRDGREEAVLTVAGQLQGRKELVGRIEGNITGKVGFDLAGGYLSLVQLKILAENEEQIPGVGTISASIARDIDVTRVPGNPHNLVMGKVKDPGPGPGPITGKVLQNVNGLLLPTDPPDPTPQLRVKNARMKADVLVLQAGKTYIFSLNSSAFDPYLRLEDPAGRQVAEDDDSGGNLNARIVYQPVQTGLHRIIATAYDGRTGPFQMIVQEAGGAATKKIDPPPVVGNTPPAGWMEAVAKNNAYAAWFPKDGKIVESEDTINHPVHGQVRVSSMTLKRADNSTFATEVIQLPKVSPKVRPELCRDLFIERIKGKVKDEKPAKLGISTGKEYVIESPAGLCMRQSGTLSQYYRAVVIGTKAQIESADADRFFESFKRSPKTGPPPPPDPIGKDPVPPGKGLFAQPAKSGMPTSYMKIVSSPGDYIGQGKTYDYTGAQLVVKRTPRGVQISVDGWNVNVGAPQGQFLQVGEYPNAKRFPFSGASPGLEFNGKGRGANRLAGEFVVWELEMNGNDVVRLAIDFVQRCEETQPPAQGKIRVNSSFQ